MAKVPGKPFQKGVSGNPEGRPNLPDELKSIKNLSADEVRKTIAKYLRMSVRDIHEMHSDNEFYGSMKALDGIVLAVIKNAMEDPKGDVNRLEFLIQRSGVPLKIEYDDSDDLDAVFNDIPPESLVEAVRGIKREVIDAIEDR